MMICSEPRVIELCDGGGGTFYWYSTVYLCVPWGIVMANSLEPSNVIHSVLWLYYALFNNRYFNVISLAAFDSFPHGSCSPNLAQRRNQYRDDSRMCRSERISSTRSPVQPDVCRGATGLQHQCTGQHCEGSSSGVRPISRQAQPELCSHSGTSDQICSEGRASFQWVSLLQLGHVTPWGGLFQPSWKELEVQHNEMASNWKAKS